MLLHELPAKPGLVQLSVAPPAAPLTLAVPVQRGPPVADGAEIVNAPENDDGVVVPEMVPFQSRPLAAHVPFTLSFACVKLTLTARDG